jgi:hypothetical protein
MANAMRNRRGRRTARLGDVIAAVFDEAARFGATPGEVSRLAVRALEDLVRRAPRLVPARDGARA